MHKVLIIVFLLSFVRIAAFAQDSICYRSKSLYKYCYDDQNAYKVVEMWGVKYGSHDTLVMVNKADTIGKGELGVLLEKGRQALLS